MERREWVFAFVISAVHAVQHIYLRLLPPLIPLLAADLGFPLWKLGLLVGARSAADGLGQTPMGMVSDRHDRRLLLPGGMAVMGGGFALFALAPSLGGGVPDVGFLGYAFTGTFAVMFVAVVVSGVGSSAVHPSAYPLITANVDDSYKGRALGMWGSAARLGDATIPLTIGALILVTAWESIVLVIGVLGVGYALVLFGVLGRGDIDTMPVEEAADEAGGRERSIWAADRRLYVYPLLAVLAFFGFRSIVTSGVTTFVPAFITQAYAYTFDVASYVISPESIANFYFTVLLLTAGVTQLGAGELVDRYDPRAVLLSYLSLAAVALAVLSFTVTSPAVLFLVLLFLGAGLWGLNPARDVLISRITPPDREGRTFGYLWTGTLLLGAVTPVVIGYVGDVVGLRRGFQLLSVATVVALVPILLLYSDRVYLRGGAMDAPADDG